jgi:Protein of unknown function (DUF1569)
MKTMFDETDRASMLTRIDRVTSGMKPRWGKMNAELMLAHLVEAMRMAIGEITPKPKKLPIRHFPLKQLIIYWIPFPKGAPTAPELLPKDTGTLDRAKSELVRLLRLFAERANATQWPEHPAFGKLTTRAWGVLAYKHCDHHLRQFGV